jgi:hypothetical protein
LVQRFRSSFRFVLVVMAFACALLGSSGVARADASSEAEALITKGVELREKGRDEEALGVFKQALAKSPTARARAQVALAEQALGMWVQAEADLTTALAMEDAWITKNRGALETALGVVRKHLGSLEVRGAENAEIYLDGARLGAGAGPFRAEAGKRQLEVRSTGFHSTTRSVEIPAGGVARETVTLVANQPASSASGSPIRNEDNGAKHETTEEDPGHGQRVLGWVFVGGGAALLATGVAGLLVRKGIVDDYNRACPGLGVAQPASCDDQVSSARTWLTVSIITLVGGSVAVGGGAVLVATAPSSPEKKAARVSCGTWGIAGITCAGAF